LNVEAEEATFRVVENPSTVLEVFIERGELDTLGAES
jgi:hypothetical protein